MTAAATGLYVDEEPPEDAEQGLLVAMVHGSMDRHRSFLRVRLELRDRRVLLYDRRGYSRSRDAQPPAGGVLDHADDLVALLAGRPAVVLGHSFGGTVALAAAARTSLVRAVVAYEPPLSWMRWWHGPGMSHTAEPFRGIDPGDAAVGFIRRVVGERRIERLLALGVSLEEYRADGPALVSELGALRRDPPPFDPREVAVPTLVVRGAETNDRQRQGTDWLAAHLPAAELHVLAGAGHNGHLSHPHEVAALVRRAGELAGDR